jgi:Uma2 family endonuclease
MALAMQPGTRISVEDFDVWAALPENRDRLLELVGGEIVEMPSNPYASAVSSRINGFLFVYLLQNPIGQLTGEAGGYKVAGERYAPDVALILSARQPELARQGYNPNAPDLAVEVDFPTTYESQEMLRVKVANYLAAGTMVWIVRPDRKMVEVYAPAKPVQLLGVDDTLRAEDLLPGFSMPVRDIFPA